MAEIKVSENSDPQNTVFLIHGYGASSASWDLVKASFPAEYVPVPIDLVGFGAVPPPCDYDFSLQMQAASLTQELRGRQTKPYSILAHSMGAAVAVIAILDFDLDVDHLILVDPLVYSQSMPFFINVQTIPFLSNIITSVISPSIQVDMVLNRIFFHPSRVNPEIRKQYIDAFERPYHRRALRETAKQLRNFDASRYTSRFGRVHSQVSIIWSRQDPLLSFGLSARLQDDLEESVLFPIENCGHAPQEECPGAFMVAVTQALRAGRQYDVD